MTRLDSLFCRSMERRRSAMAMSVNVSSAGMNFTVDLNPAGKAFVRNFLFHQQCHQPAHGYRQGKTNAVDRRVQGHRQMLEDLPLRPVAKPADVAAGMTLGVRQQIVVRLVSHRATPG